MKKQNSKIQSLQRRGSELAKAAVQVSILEETAKDLPSFEQKLEALNLYPLRPTGLDIFQVNVGKMCNQTCEHCHVDAGPTRKEIMTRQTMRLCLEAIQKANPKTIDITGGAPEMNPDFQWFIEQLRTWSLEVEIIVRSNLTILVSNSKYRTYPDFFAKHKLTVIASLPCYTEGNTDAQRGDGTFVSSIEALQNLNALGYAKSDSSLLLHLVYNPGGAFLPGAQDKLQADYKRILKENYNIEFNNLYTITNLPISRFLDYLLQEQKFHIYMDLLVNSFNPTAAEGLMCRNTLSVSWDGSLYDCDFNQMLNLPTAEAVPKHIKDFDLEVLNRRAVVVGQHCFGCAAGAGSSCQGSLS